MTYDILILACFLVLGIIAIINEVTIWKMEKLIKAQRAFIDDLLKALRGENP